MTLEEQDRTLRERDQIGVGLELLERTAKVRPPGPYQLKARIAAVHASTSDPATTDWRAIVGFYDDLLELERWPIVALNRAVAVAMADGPTDGLRLLDAPTLVEGLSEYHLYHVTRADLLRRSGRLAESAAAYEVARRHTDNLAEHEFLDRRLRELSATPG